LNIQIAVGNSTNYTNMGTTQFLSVPYALHAKTATEALTADYNNLYNAPTTIDDADADPTNELQNWTTLPGIPADIADGDDNTQLTETEVDAMVQNNGFQQIADDGDIDATNELQTISVNDHDLTISDGNTIILPDNVDDADADPENEIELPTGGLSGQVLTVKAGGGYEWTTITGGGSCIECKDYDGNYYRTVTIGNQVWRAENLKTTHYADGTLISGVYDNGVDYVNAYGRVYSWNAAMHWATSSEGNPSEVQGACPDGWHLPSDAEWTELIDLMTYLGHSGTEGTALKAIDGWDYNGNGTDDYGFSALPGGYRENDSHFYTIGYSGFWWSASEYSASSAWAQALSTGPTISRGSINKEGGHSVRCVRD